MRFAMQCVVLFAIASFSCAAQVNFATTTNTNALSGRFVNPDLLSFDDLVALASTAKPEAPLAGRLDVLLKTPFIHTETAMGKIKPKQPIAANLGPILRVGEWNIERGLNLDLIESAPADPNGYVHWSVPQGSGRARETEIESQLAGLQGIDVLVLNEVDWGMKRTAYKDIAEELATALQMNYAYGVEFVELDPVFELGVERVHLSDADQDQRLQQDLQVDPRRYHGLHGTAILSRYPIQNARILRLPVCYDWYGKEYKAISKLERGRRWSVDKLFRERIERELRRGGRMALVVDISVPELPSGQATIVATHLENRCKPACRNLQNEDVAAGSEAGEKPSCNG